ncbi:FAS-associated death domain protein [Esox lucius]|uniref:Death domain-containing protein n=1 Tax=Esox lucius TaxID=8010 RepID=A0A3P8XST1_ESOLU|nr:FAS-associated death domain protein [Esox lucius]
MAQVETGQEPPSCAQQLLRRLKVPLIEALSADPDFVLQHADSLSLLSHREYRQLKALTDPYKQARDLLDHVIHKSGDTSEEFLQLLMGKELQEMFPKLMILKELPGNDQGLAGEKRRQTVEPEENLPAKQTCSNGSKMVKEKDLMRVARGIGHSWREIGTGALDIPSVQLEQIQENYPNNHVDRVFAMLRYWSRLKRSEATAACLHSLLSQGDWALPPDSIDFLLDTS